MNPMLKTLLAFGALAPFSLFGVISIDNAAFTYSEDFDQTSLAGSNFTNDVSIPGWFVGNGNQVVDGGFSTPRVYHDGDIFGTYTRDGRPLQAVAVQFQNNTGVDITGLSFSFDQQEVDNANNQGVVPLDIEYAIGTSVLGANDNFTTYSPIASPLFTDSVQAQSYSPSFTLGAGEYLLIRFYPDPDSVVAREDFSIDNFSVTAVEAIPEPSALALLGFGAFALMIAARRR